MAKYASVMSSFMVMCSPYLLPQSPL